ncbi:hypothetical protein FISHEDRAFT_77347 [Fistulina hepatica ATCC 64428]|uniref:Uncharacterized protein n=1 Tax=Fistulina hepatica ATCC 64428 TaxID=1128425 RepID=A0A0D7A491_9AGAR|nr:hypothetical protein FISHEDRAFT_77347 [Fistulina hepatica ATCC 64428]
MIEFEGILWIASFCIGFWLMASDHLPEVRMGGALITTRWSKRRQELLRDLQMSGRRYRVPPPKYALYRLPIDTLIFWLVVIPFLISLCWTLGRASTLYLDKLDARAGAEHPQESSRESPLSAHAVGERGGADASGRPRKTSMGNKCKHANSGFVHPAFRLLRLDFATLEVAILYMLSRLYLCMFFLARQYPRFRACLAIFMKPVAIFIIHACDVALAFLAILGETLFVAIIRAILAPVAGSTATTVGSKIDSSASASAVKTLPTTESLPYLTNSSSDSTIPSEGSLESLEDVDMPGTFSHIELEQECSSREAALLKMMYAEDRSSSRSEDGPFVNSVASNGVARLGRKTRFQAPIILHPAQEQETIATWRRNRRDNFFSQIGESSRRRRTSPPPQ